MTPPRLTLPDCTPLAYPLVWQLPSERGDARAYATISYWPEPSIPSLLDNFYDAAVYISTAQLTHAVPIGLQAALMLPKPLLDRIRARDPPTLERIASMFAPTSVRQQHETIDAILFQYGHLPEEYVRESLQLYRGPALSEHLANSGWSDKMLIDGLGYQWSVLAELDVSAGLPTDPTIVAGRSICIEGLDPISDNDREHAQRVLRMIAPGLATRDDIRRLEDHATISRELMLGEVAERLAQGRFGDPPGDFTLTVR